MEKTITEECEALLTFLQERGLSEREACAVMGETIAALIVDPDEARKFLRTLESRLPKTPH